MPSAVPIPNSSPRPAKSSQTPATSPCASNNICGLPSVPLFTIRPTTPTAFYCEPEAGYFFYPSRINAAKRQHLAVQALAGQASAASRRLILCGESEDDAYYQNLQDEVARLGSLRPRPVPGPRHRSRKNSASTPARLAVIYPPFRRGLWLRHARSDALRQARGHLHRLRRTPGICGRPGHRRRHRPGGIRKSPPLWPELSENPAYAAMPSAKPDAPLT